MNKKTLVVSLVIFAALAPFAATAIAAQSTTSVSASVSTAQAMPARWCSPFNRNLARGQYGDDVRSLQSFLSTEGAFSASATGYFGPATARALAKWQASQGIASLGFLGPITRARIENRCVNGGLLNVTPKNGSAPLTVTATSKIGDSMNRRPSVTDGQDTVIDFGDGTDAQWVSCTLSVQDSNPSRCVSPVSFMHTYANDGTYTVSLKKSGGFCQGCEKTLASEQVSVGTVVSNTLDASPQSGNAPLTVVFTTNVSINEATPSVDFGDGQKDVMVKGSCIAIMAIRGGQGGIRCAETVSHTYTQNGTYTATALNGSGAITGTTVITVGDASSQGTLSADPQSGSAPLPVTFTYHPTTDQSGQYWIEFGDGQGQIMDTHQIYCFRAPCISPVVASHTYSSTGTYSVFVERYIGCQHTNPRCMIATMPLAHTTVTVNGGTGKGTPAISAFSGPTSLGVSETGTWKITASDPENGTLNYSILWGDEVPNYGATLQSRAQSAAVNQDTTFTHSYAKPGTYTVAVSVSDAAGNLAKSTATVQVSQGVCTADYAPVCGRPNGCANTCAPGTMCTMQCQLYQPQTYSNRCAMNNSNATFMHDGACTGNEGYVN